MSPTRTMTRRAALAALLVLVTLGLGACGGDSEGSAETTTDTTTTTTEPPATTTAEPPATTETTPKPKPTVVSIVVRGGKVTGGIKRVKIEQGKRVTLVVTSDIADEVHLHGYDLTADAGPGRKARIVFTAKIPGRFEVELEGRGIQIGELEVRP